MKNVSNITLKRGTAESMLRQVARELGVEPEKDCRRSQVALSREAGGGQLIAYSDLTGMDALIFDLPGEVDWTFEMEGDFPEPISFFTVCSGMLNVVSEDEAFRVAALQSAIHGGFNSSKHHLRLRGDDGMIMMVNVHKENFFNSMDCDTLEIPEKLLEVVEDLEKVAPHFLFSDIFHLPIVNAVKDIIEQKDIGLLSSSFAAAKVHEVLFLQLNEYNNHHDKANRRVVRRKEKIQLIRDAETILISRLKNPPTIPELARMVGLNQQTLKQGFRQLHGASINQHLNEKRMEQAGILIRAGELSIGEVALEVGYNNAGYFSRKFKERYGVTPRYFSQAEGTN